MSHSKLKERREYIRRREDKRKVGLIERVPIEDTLDQFICRFLCIKKSGISIFTTIKMTKIKY